MASVNGDVKMFLTYLKTIYVKMENLLGSFPLGNGPFYLKTSWRVQRARMLGAVLRQKMTLIMNLLGYQRRFSGKTQTQTQTQTQVINRLTFFCRLQNVNL